MENAPTRISRFRVVLTKIGHVWKLTCFQTMSMHIRLYMAIHDYIWLWILPTNQPTNQPVAYDPAAGTFFAQKTVHWVVDREFIGKHIIHRCFCVLPGSVRLQNTPTVRGNNYGIRHFLEISKPCKCYDL